MLLPLLRMGHRPQSTRHAVAVYSVHTVTGVVVVINAADPPVTVVVVDVVGIVVPVVGSVVAFFCFAQSQSRQIPSTASKQFSALSRSLNELSNSQQQKQRLHFLPSSSCNCGPVSNERNLHCKE